MESAYRWSPEVEQQFLSLMAVGCSAAIVAEQIGCSERMARTLVRRHRVGLPLYSGPARDDGEIVTAKATPGRRPGKWAERVEAMSAEQREALRCKALSQIIAGRTVEFVATSVKAPKSVVEAWIEEWDGGPVDMPEGPDAPPAVVEPEWPDWAKFEDCPKAVRADRGGERIIGMSHVYRYTRGAMDRQSYCSNSTAWL